MAEHEETLPNELHQPVLVDQQGDANPHPAKLVDNETARVKVANNVRDLPPAQHRNQASAMESEELAYYVVRKGCEALLKLVELKPYVEVLWDRFDNLTTGQMIAGCKTKTEFCEKCLHRSIRAVQYLLYGRTPAKPKANNVRLEDETNSHDTGTDADADDSSEDESDESGDAQDECEDIKTGHEFLAAHTGSRLKVLAGKSVANDSTQVERTAEPPQPPPILGDPVPEPDPGSLEELRLRISRMADTYEIENALEDYLDGLVKPVLEHHPYTPSVVIEVSIRRIGKKSIDTGDWVEYKGDDSRLTKQIGMEEALGRVVGEDKLHRPQVRWYNGKKWQEPYSLFENSESSVWVLFDFQAAEQYPEAFRCYPADAKGAKVAQVPVEPVTEAVKPSLPDSQIADKYSVSEYVDEFAIWKEPRKRGDRPYNILPTREEAEAQAAMLSAGGSIGGSVTQKSSQSVDVPPISALAVTDDVAATDHDVVLEFRAKYGLPEADAEKYVAEALGLLHLATGNLTDSEYEELLDTAKKCLERAKPPKDAVDDTGRNPVSDQGTTVQAATTTEDVEDRVAKA